MIYYIADTHFSHANIIKLCNRPFTNVEEMNRIMIHNWNSKVSKNDYVYIVGDFAFKDNNAVEILKKLNGHKTLIIGNHDSKNLKNNEFKNCFEEIVKDKIIFDNNRRVFLYHYPVIEWDGFFRNTYLVYGHIHNNVSNYAYKCMKELDLALNAGVDINNFTPVTLDECYQNNVKFKKEN